MVPRAPHAGDFGRPRPAPRSRAPAFCATPRKPPSCVLVSRNSSIAATRTGENVLVSCIIIATTIFRRAMWSALSCSFERRHCAQPCHDGVEVGSGHAAEIALTGHGLLECPPVTRHTMREGSLDLHVGPRADTAGRVRRDVGGDRGTPGALEQIAAPTEGVLVV